MHLLTPYSLFYAYFPYQRFLLFGFFFFPFPLISKTNLPAHTALVHRKRKRMYHKTIHFVKHLFLFFILFFKFFFTQPYKSYNLKKIVKKLFLLNRFKSYRFTKSNILSQAKTWKTYTTLHCIFSQLELFIEETDKSINAFYTHPAAVSQTMNATARILLQFPSLCQYLLQFIVFYNNKQNFQKHLPNLSKNYILLSFFGELAQLVERLVRNQ